MTKKSTSEKNSTSKKATITTWIKINLNIFENEKIKALEHMTHGDTYIVIWFKLLCMAGTVNDKGMIYLIEGKPYTLENLAHSMNRPIKLVKKAMELFEDLKMIEVIEGIIVPINWAKYQSIDRLNELSEYNRIKQHETRERNKENVNLLSIENQRLSIIEVEVDIKNMKEKNTKKQVTTPPDIKESKTPLPKDSVECYFDNLDIGPKLINGPEGEVDYEMDNACSSKGPPN